MGNTIQNNEKVEIMEEEKVEENAISYLNGYAEFNADRMFISEICKESINIIL